MRVLMSVVLGFGLAVASSACQEAEQEEELDMEGARTALLEVDRTFSALSESDGYIEAYYRYSADDVLLLPPGALPKAGREEIYRSDSEEGLMGRLSWEPEDARVASSGELGWSWGEWAFIVEDEEGAPQESYGKYLFVWEKVGGAWRMAVNMWNDNPEA
jgi:ketosteroid isomerase-like protein